MKKLFFSIVAAAALLVSAPAFAGGYDLYVNYANNGDDVYAGQKNAYLSLHKSDISNAAQGAVAENTNKAKAGYLNVAVNGSKADIYAKQTNTHFSAYKSDISNSAVGSLALNTNKGTKAYFGNMSFNNDTVTARQYNIGASISRSSISNSAAGAVAVNVNR